MKNKIVLVLVAVVLMLGFSACGSDTASEGNFTGVWKLETIESDGEVTNIAEYESLGLTGTLTLNEDLTLSMDLLGNESSGKWKAKNATTMSMTVDGTGSATGVLVDDKLVMEEDDSKLVFVRG